jgi:hypothetical protein
MSRKSLQQALAQALAAVRTTITQHCPALSRLATAKARVMQPHAAAAAGSQQKNSSKK